MEYKVVVKLDEILKEKGISQYSLIKGSGLSHNFINKLVKHKDVANLDKLATIINVLNSKGANVKPSDLVQFVPVNNTQIQVIASQRLKDSMYCFFELKYQGFQYRDLIKLNIKQQASKLFIQSEANDTPLYNFNDHLQSAISHQSLILGKGVEKLVQLPISEKRVAAQLLSTAIINQCLASGSIKSYPNYIINFDYFDLFNISFEKVDRTENTINIVNYKDDAVIPFYPEAYQATYPFMHAFSTGKITKGEHFTKPKPHKLTEAEQERIDDLKRIFNIQNH